MAVCEQSWVGVATWRTETSGARGAEKQNHGSGFSGIWSFADCFVYFFVENLLCNCRGCLPFVIIFIMGLEYQSYLEVEAWPAGLAMYSRINSI